MVESLSRPPQAMTRGETWINASSDWIEYFGLALSVHHGATAEPLALTAFETVFRNACEYVGWPLDRPGSLTRRFVDVTVEVAGETRKLSLKSTAARDLSRTKAHISKLTEAAWIQDARTPSARRDAMLDLFRQYREAVDAILMLRAFRGSAGSPPQRYQLLEIPVGCVRLHPSLVFTGLRARCPGHRLPDRRRTRRLRRGRSLRREDHRAENPPLRLYRTCRMEPAMNDRGAWYGARQLSTRTPLETRPKYAIQRGERGTQLDHAPSNGSSPYCCAGA